MRATDVLILVIAAGGCTAQAEGVPRAQSSPQQRADSGAGRFVRHDEHIQAGLARQATPSALANPYEGNARAAEDGGKLFVAYNCADCHGAEGSGAMGPSLQDSRWHFGGAPAAVFQSIYEGRPDGMPSWGGRISDDQIWRLVAYVRSLETGKQVSTENFTGKLIERTGH
jgi:cytochrome c oxidase cbb3-type subunit 3